MHPRTSQSRHLYTAKTVSVSKAAIDAERELAWGTMDQAPNRIARPTGASLFDWGIVVALVMMFAGATTLGGATILAAAAVVFLNSNPGVAAANVAEAPIPVVVQAQAPQAPVKATAAPIEPAPTRVSKKRARSSSRARTASRAQAPRAIPTQSAGEVVCRLAMMAWEQGHKVLVRTGSEDEARQLDELMWDYPPGRFLPHGPEPAGDDVPVSIATRDDAMSARTAAMVTTLIRTTLRAS